MNVRVRLSDNQIGFIMGVLEQSIDDTDCPKDSELIEYSQNRKEVISILSKAYFKKSAKLFKKECNKKV